MSNTDDYCIVDLPREKSQNFGGLNPLTPLNTALGAASHYTQYHALSRQYKFHKLKRLFRNKTADIKRIRE